jgi:phosphoglycolate phosphatase
MISKYKHIIWDWNGTIFNDVSLCLDIINGILIKRNLKVLTLNEYRNAFTFPIKEYYIKIGFDFTKYTFEEVGIEWMNEYERRRSESHLHNEVERLLNHIANLGIGQSMLSAYPHNYLVEVVRHHKLDSYFTHLVGLDHIYASSKINLGKKLIEKLNHSKEEILLIGDTLHDFEVANEIGAECILVANGHQSKERLLKSGATVVDNLGDL